MANTAYGTCMYLEFRKGPITAQRIIIPEHARMGISASGTAGITVMHREQDISKNETRQPWAIDVVTATAADSPIVRTFDQNDQLVAKYSIQQALEESAELYRHIDDLIMELVDREFRLYQKPLFAEIGPAEVRDLDEQTVPDGLIRRVDRVRKDAGFSLKLWDMEYIKS